MILEIKHLSKILSRQRISMKSEGDGARKRSGIILVFSFEKNAAIKSSLLRAEPHGVT